MKFTILGAGAFGTALGGVLEENGHEVVFHDQEVGAGELSGVIEGEGAEAVVLAVPSSVAEEVLSGVPKELPLVVATKGFLSVGAFEGFSDVMAISGPGFAEEIVAQKKTILTATDVRVVKWFSTEYLGFDFSSDLTGVLMCGALKNVYAIGAGYRGLKTGEKSWEEYVAAAEKEMEAIVAANGGKAGTVRHACGRGDLRLTCNPPSRNYEFGAKLGENPDYRPEKTVEGVTAIGKIKRGGITIPQGCEVLAEILEEVVWA